MGTTGEAGAQGQVAETALQAAQLMRGAAAALPRLDAAGGCSDADLFVSYWWQVSALA